MYIGEGGIGRYWEGGGVGDGWLKQVYGVPFYYVG